jgi:hypothetical protein
MTDARPSTPLSDPWKVAALTYLVYGIVYLGGAWNEMTPERLIAFEEKVIPWWVYFVIGGLFTIGMPALLLRQIRWMGTLLGLATAGKALYLIWSQGRHIAAGEPTEIYNWFFALVAITTSVALLRAVLTSPGSSDTSQSMEVTA